MTIEQARLEIHRDVPGVASEPQDPSTDTDPPEILDSWHRSAENYHVNRLSRSAPHMSPEPFGGISVASPVRGIPPPCSRMQKITRYRVLQGS